MQKPPISVLKRSNFCGPGMPLGIFYDVRVIPRHEHSHEFTEIVLVYQGNARHVMGEESRRVSAGDVFVLTPGQIHSYDHCDDFGVCNIIFDQGRLNLVSLDLYDLPGFHALFSLEPGLRQRHMVPSFHLNPHEMRYCLRLAKKMERELNSRSPGFIYFASLIFMRIVGFLSRRFTENPSPEKHGLLRLGKVISHIGANFSRQLSVRELAELAHISEAQFYRNFRDATGCTPMQYINRLRLARAEDMLRQSDNSVTEIAYLCGFNDSNYFSRLFSKTRGKSPSAFRREFLPGNSNIH